MRIFVELTQITTLLQQHEIQIIILYHSGHDFRMFVLQFTSKGNIS